MASIDFDGSGHRLRRSSVWRSVMHKVTAWANGDILEKQGTALLEHALDFETSSFDLISPNLIHNSVIYVVDYPSGDLPAGVSDVAAAAISVLTFDSFGAALRMLARDMHSNVVLVVNIDVFPDLEDAIENLLGAKNMVSTVPIVICSKAFSVNNFSLQRRAIADSSLRLPCNDVSLALAIESGIMNNRKNIF
jgi:hypothetical protein